MKCFRKVILENEDKFCRFGIQDGNLASHSAGKGSASHASSILTVSPPIVSVCLHAQWSMRYFKERYCTMRRLVTNILEGLSAVFTAADACLLLHLHILILIVQLTISCLQKSWMT